MLVAALVLQLVVLYSPGSSVPSVPIPGLDKAIHLFIFALPALLIRRLTRRYWPLLLLGAHAGLSEVIQHFFVAHRGGDWLDMVTDLVGVAIGVALGSWAFRRADEPAERPASAAHR